MKDWKTINYRPSVDDCDSYKTGQLETCFATMKLVNKTVCEDRIVYIFAPLNPTNKN